MPFRRYPCQAACWAACVMLDNRSRDVIWSPVTVTGLMNQPSIHYIKAEFIETVSRLL